MPSIPRSLIVWSLAILGCGVALTSSGLIASSAEAQTNRRKPKATADVQPGDWPCWRGADGSGRVAKADIRTEWDAPPPTLWTAQVGTGFSGISVSEGRAYTMGHADGQETVWCFNAETGEELWKHTYPCRLVDNLHEGGPAATPTVDGTGPTARVFTVSKEGQVFCLNATTGEAVWNVKLPELTGVPMPEWGFSSSAVILNNALYVEAGRLAALNKLTGAGVWATDKAKPGYGTPALWKVGSKTLVASLNNDRLVIADALRGQLIDSVPWETQYATSAATPVVDGNKVFISTGYGRGCALFELSSSGKLSKKYENREMRNHMAYSVLYDGHFYGIDGNTHDARNGKVVCIDAATGKSQWSHRGLGVGTLLVAGANLLILSDSGELVIAPAKPEAFEPTARAEILDGKCWTVPTLAHGRLYARDAGGKLVCVDLRR